MSLDLKELKDLHDKAYEKGQVTRQRAADDMVFYFVTQWDDLLLDESQLAYRGEFDILRKAGRQILAKLEENPVSIDFQPKAEERNDGADVLTGLYRADDRNNCSIEAFDNCQLESVVCGVGAWELITQYENLRAGNTRQVIKRKAIYEANNTVFWDPAARKLDKSDAGYASKITAYTVDSYKELHKELTGEETECAPSNFANPEISYTFPWFAQQKLVYVTEFYHREKVTEKVFIMEDPLGHPMAMLESAMEGIEDELIDQGYIISDTRTVDRFQVTKYIASGEDILNDEVIAGEHIPIVPCYGERAFVEDEEHYEGVTRLAKDPQRLSIVVSLRYC